MATFLRYWFEWIFAPSFRSRINAQDSAIAVGRDIRDSTITVGLDEQAIGEKIQAAQGPILNSLDVLAALIAREKGLDAAPLRAILAKFGEAQVPDNEIPLRLESIADQLIELRAELQSDRQDDISATKRKALAFIDAGDLSEATLVLERGRLASRSLREGASRNEAEFLADQARIDELQLDYRSAALKYQDAATLLSHDHGLAFGYLSRQATALQNLGEEFGDSEALCAAILVWRKAKELRPFEIAPDDHRKAHNNLSSAIYALGIRESGNKYLEEVVAMNREVLARDTRDAAPICWVAAQNNLGSALQVIGEREQGIERLLEAVARYRDALSGVSRELEPIKWAGIQSNIGNAFKFMAERQRNEQLFHEAIAAYREAILELSPETARFQRAMTLSNLAATLADFGTFQNRAEPFEEARAMLEDVLQLVPRERYPVQWAAAKNNISSALNRLGLIRNDVNLFHDACSASRDALAVYTRAGDPLSWASCMWGVGIALSMIAERTRSITDACAAVDALSSAYEVIVNSANDQAKPGISQALSEARVLLDVLRGSSG